MRADVSADVVIVGAGAGGLIAALRAKATGADVLVLEADPVPRGSTALSAGLIPAAGTQAQRAAGIRDTPAAFAADITFKAKGEPDPALVASMTALSAPAVDWLYKLGLNLTVVDDFTYPGHSARRMHGLPSRAGLDLIDALRSVAEAHDIPIVTERRVTEVHHDQQIITAVTAQRLDGADETVGCTQLILACNGYGGDPGLLAMHMPEIASAIYFGHTGNQGDALRWGEALGAETRHLGAYQGHGNVAQPQGILITWATITEGGVQVNMHGNRFWDESQGYSEAARAVLAQPEGTAWTVFDSRIAGIARQFEDFRQAEAIGAILTSNSLEHLAGLMGVPRPALIRALSHEPQFGRAMDPAKSLEPPYCAVRVTGALFHTQGGLRTDPVGRVMHHSGKPLSNLWAVGGAACGVSGAGDSGYLSGNGLLSAVTLGYAAGDAAGKAT